MRPVMVRPDPTLDALVEQEAQARRISRAQVFVRAANFYFDAHPPPRPDSLLDPVPRETSREALDRARRDLDRAAHAEG